MWEEKNRERFDLFINDIIRLFHNYVAGTKTMLDHVHALQDDMLRGVDFSDKYRARWDQQFGGSLLPQFVEDLVTHMHYKGILLPWPSLAFAA